MSEIKQEKSIKGQPIAVPLKGIRTILSQMENCICIIYPKEGEKGTGFFCKIPFQNNYLPVLVTNNHVLNENEIEDGKTIKLMINNKVKNIDIDNSRAKYTNPDKNIDITIIEIKPNKDKIGLKNYLELDENDLYQNKENIELDYPGKSIYILHYPKGKLNASFGIIKTIDDKKNICHKCNTEDGSSGSPILSLETFKVIGIHYGCSKNYDYNYGVFIKCVVDILDNFIKNESMIKEKIVKQNENILFKTTLKPFYPSNRYYKMSTENNLGKNKTERFNHELNEIHNNKFYNNNVVKDKENTPSKISYFDQYNLNYLIKKSESTIKLYDRSMKLPYNLKYSEIKDISNTSKKKENLDSNDKKGIEIFNAENILSKYTDIIKKINNLVRKEKNETNILTYSNRNLNRQNLLNEESLSSSKTKKIDENMKNNKMSDLDYKSGIISKKKNIKNNDAKMNDSYDRNAKNKLNKGHMLSFDGEDYENINSKVEENKYRKIIYRKDNKNKLIYQKYK